ncbi:MAG: hypothetical protein LBN33_09490 [Desulfovibrio sp.]|jgi:uncharacterized Zn finger protein|nr:hypothetical protein [Desulfovibrio sp.]
MWGYSEYVPVAKRKDQAQKKVEQLRRKNPDLAPVVIEGRKIATTWWGIAWNKNMESYADIANRIARGSSYVRNGYVVDLQINEGLITAQVLGSHLYKITISITKLADKKWTDITKQCAKRITDMAELAEGKFQKEMESVFMRQGEGLFPSPKEINFACSCPDQYGTHMCKHVASALYGVGRRLDDDPMLFFRLRGADPGELLRASIEERTAALLLNADRRSKRVIADKDVNRIFGDTEVKERSVFKN